MGMKIYNATPPTVLIQSEPNFMINKAVIGEYKLIMFWRAAKNFVAV